jgi:hypothetical protein
MVEIVKQVIASFIVKGEVILEITNPREGEIPNKGDQICIPYRDNPHASVCLTATQIRRTYHNIQTIVSIELS